MKTIEYQYGDEKKIQRILYKSKEPILIRIKEFPDIFSLDYFEQNIKASATYDAFENRHWRSHHVDDFKTVISQIKKNMPFRIFGQVLSVHESAEIEQYVPLWQTIPFRPRLFLKQSKVIYFFGGKGACTSIHFDREHNHNLHLCLGGKKQMLLFTEDQSDNLYKVPYIGDSLIDFSQSLSSIRSQFPRINQASGYNVMLEKGDMLYIPKNCWHYTIYHDASSAAGYSFYPKKLMQFYGYFTGFFYMGYKARSGFNMSNWPIFQKFSRNYALSSGKIKYVYKFIELTSYLFILPIVSVMTIISQKRNPRKVY